MYGTFDYGLRTRHVYNTTVIRATNSNLCWGTIYVGVSRVSTHPMRIKRMVLGTYIYLYDVYTRDIY